MEKEINTVIDRLINEELKEASNCATRGTVNMRVFLKIARLMGISLQSLYDTQHLVRIDPSLSKAFELLWNGYSPIHTATVKESEVLRYKIVGDEEKSSEDTMLLERFLSKDFARPADISKILSTLEKRLVGWDDKLFRELGYLFGADGLLESDPNRFEHYSERLAIPITLGERLDDDSNEELIETHVRAVRTLYRDVKYATTERIGKTLRKLLEVDSDPLPRKKRGDGRSSPSSESSDGSVSSDDYSDEYDKYIADRYKTLVGKKIDVIMRWIRERIRIRKEEEKQNFRKRAVATKRKLASSDEKPHENKENDFQEIKDMPKKSEREKTSTRNLNHDPLKTETLAVETNESSENVTSSAAVVPTSSMEPKKKKQPETKKSETHDSSETENVTSSAAATVSTSSIESKKKKQSQIKKSEKGDSKKRKKSEKPTVSKKLKKTEIEVANNNESLLETKVEKVPTEIMEFDKKSGSNNVDGNEDYE